MDDRGRVSSWCSLIIGEGADGDRALSKPKSNCENLCSWGGGVSARAGASRCRLRSSRMPITAAATRATPPIDTPTASGTTALLSGCCASGGFVGGGGVAPPVAAGAVKAVVCAGRWVDEVIFDLEVVEV